MRYWVVVLFFLTGCKTLGGGEDVPAPQELKADLEERTLQYFLDHAHPKTGMVRDKAENFKSTPDSNRVSSIAATGFGLAVIANASIRGLVTKEYAREYAIKTLRFTRDHVGRYKGWMFHFVDWETGEQRYRSEYSTIDTALFMGGALYAAQVLGDKEVKSLAYQLYNDLDFHDMLTDGGKKPKKKTLSMAYWNDGTGYRTDQWDMYAEQMLLLLLGLGHPSRPLPVDTWLAFDRSLRSLPNGEQVMGFNGALFLHQYSQLFVDFRGFRDGYENYHSNSILMSQWHRELMRREPTHASLAAGFWGFSAGEAPNGTYKVFDASRYEGIVCIGCTAASVMFMPEVMLDMIAWRSGPYADKVWGRYGFTDSVDIGNNWFSPTVLGITLGPEYMALANTNPQTSIWRDFMQVPEIKTALEKASKVVRPLATVPPKGRKPASNFTKTW
ncbi:MAG: hypothetical protein KF799_05850 [Bdellovibrionales bacterium]|nr:hypothetical protein [Bdellovibrionales bacterium]